MSTLLQQRDEARHRQRLALCESTRRLLREHLAALIPGQRVVVFGSLLQPGRFNAASDIDLALEREPEGISVGQLMSKLSERLGRPVDVVLPDHCRFRDRILKEGDVWIS
ncbi:MAG: hypothetical protein FJW27_01135 [Acidimicrobiia bacterium]|nr:hypothetical protein [Acidimicrobiia bacterium]